MQIHESSALVVARCVRIEGKCQRVPWCARLHLHVRVWRRMSPLSQRYDVSKVIMLSGWLGDRTDPRYLICAGQTLSAVAQFVFGALTEYTQFYSPPFYVFV